MHALMHTLTHSLLYLSTQPVQEWQREIFFSLFSFELLVVRHNDARTRLSNWHCTTLYNIHHSLTWFIFLELFSVEWVYKYVSRYYVYLSLYNSYCIIVVINFLLLPKIPCNDSIKINFESYVYLMFCWRRRDF